MKKSPRLLVLYTLVIICCCTQIAAATPPPPEYRVAYLLPNPVGPYYNQSVNLGFLVSSPHNSTGTFPAFPQLSEYRASRNFTYAKTGDPYFSEVWYFNNGDSFAAGRNELMTYVQEHGTSSPVILDLSEDLARAGDPYIAGLHATRVNATAYRANDTSGYFIVFSTDFFPGENYYIAYYGTVGRSDPGNATPQIKTLIVSCFPGFVEGRAYTFDPVLPLTTTTSRPAGLSIFAAAFAVAICAAVCFFGRQ